MVQLRVYMKKQYHNTCRSVNPMRCIDGSGKYEVVLRKIYPTGLPAFGKLICYKIGKDLVVTRKV